MAGGLIASTDYAAATHSRSQAENLAQQDEERLKGFSAAQLYNLNQTYAADLQPDERHLPGEHLGHLLG